MENVKAGTVINRVPLWLRPNSALLKHGGMVSCRNMSSGRRQYPFHLIEPKWQQFWEQQQTFRAFNPGETIPAGHPFGERHGLSGKQPARSGLPPKFYILDMFPYPSGAGLH